MKNAMKAPSVTPLPHINRHYHTDENLIVADMLAAIPLDAAARDRIKGKTRTLVENVRKTRRRFGGVDKFLNEFGLTTDEGIALMCLAEALLRIPDADTADKLIRDKIGSADWDKHLGKGEDLFVNASTWALMLTGKVVGNPADDHSRMSVSGIAGKMVTRLGEPVIRQAVLHAMKIMGQQFVMGRNIGDALDRAKEQEKIGYRYSYDMLGEGARTMEDAERYFESYAKAIDAIGQAAAGRGVHDAPGISVKLSALHPRYEYAQRDICVPALTEKLKALAIKCALHDIGLTVDAEEAHRLEISLDIFDAVLADPALKGWEGFGLAVQAYQKRCSDVIDRVVESAVRFNRRIMVRLVKGAYWDTEVKYAQVMGLPGYPVFTRKNATDVSFLANAAKLLERRDVIYPMFATHNAWTLAAILEMAGEDKAGFEFQRLHGMGEPLYHQIVGHAAGQFPCRIYAPVGNHQDLLPYLVRRLLENGANTSFVNRLQDDRVPIEDMLVDPVDYIEKLDSKPHPKIALPEDMYKTRKNSRGVEFADSAVSDELFADIEKHFDKQWTAAPLINGVRSGGEKQNVTDPTDNSRIVGTVINATKEDMARALDTAHKAFPRWNATPADTRAACLHKMADLMEQHMAELIALCVREAGKCLPDARDEIREAVDFCRFYAEEGKKHFGTGTSLPGPTGESNTLTLEGRGTFLCISPWNFPLAIFTGQVTAALMAGNCVIAKPAGQTPLIAMRAVELLIEAGTPKDVMTLLPASGRAIGEQLVPDPRIAGVCFTGSTETAQQINKTLAARDGVIVPFIAETGGQNALIVGSSALPEQVIDDVIMSAFRSAGQRCSALRVLYVHEGIADKVITMLEGACRELRLAGPRHLSTDIGPVIDTASLDTLKAHAAEMEKVGKPIATVPPTQDVEKGTFFAPRAFEIPSATILKREVFGPILHVVRYKAGTLDKVVEEINATGYGLAFGMHTRIDHVMRDVVKKIRAGNCYINRSIIGAVVGTQPFGGQGLSGTGPKAGGPHYLLRFANEKTLTINTTASGGNTTLVSLSEDD